MAQLPLWRYEFFSYVLCYHTSDIILLWKLCKDRATLTVGVPTMILGDPPFLHKRMGIPFLPHL